MTSTIQSMNDTKSGFKRYSVSNCWLLLILWSGIDIRLQEKSAFMGGSNYHQSGHFLDVGWHTTIKQFIWETHQPGHLVKQNYCAQHSPTRVGRNWVYHQVREMRENFDDIVVRGELSEDGWNVHNMLPWDGQGWAAWLWSGGWYNPNKILTGGSPLSIHKILTVCICSTTICSDLEFEPI